MSPDQLRAASLAQVPIFAGLPADETEHLLAVLHLQTVPAGEVLVRENEPGNCLYIILEGEVEVVLALGTPDERIVGVREPGAFFGEMSLLDPAGRRTASVRTLTPARLWVLKRPDFEQLLQRRPGLAYEMLRVVSLRLRESHTKTISDLHERNEKLSQAYEELRAAQAQLIEKERLERELQVARQIQKSILPRHVPEVRGFEFGVRFEPARAVGGDLYDFIPLSRGRLGIVIGDVSDKGVPAAIFMGLTRSLLRAEATRSAAPAQVLRRVNRLMLTMNDSGMFCTLLYGILDPRTGAFDYARAGHELPLLFSPDGTVTELEYSAGQPLGMFHEPYLDECTVAVPAGHTLLLMTDGTTDARNAAGERFRTGRLSAAGRANLGIPAQAMCDGIWNAIAGFQAGTPQADDVVLLAMRACA